MVEQIPNRESQGPNKFEVGFCKSKKIRISPYTFRFKNSQPWKVQISMLFGAAKFHYDFCPGYRNRIWNFADPFKILISIF